MMDWRKNASLGGPSSREPVEVRSREKICSKFKALVFSAVREGQNGIRDEASRNDLLTASRHKGAVSRANRTHVGRGELG